MGGMKNMLKAFITVILICLMTVVCIGCGNKEAEDVILPENEIILIKQYDGWYGGAMIDGYFIDSKGDVYSYDFSRPCADKGSSGVELNELELIRQYTQPFTTVKPTIVKQIYEYGMKIDPTSEFTTKENTCDAGQRKVIFHNPETGELLVCCEDGDTTARRQDPYAEKIRKLYNKKLQDEIDPENQTVLYTDNETYLTCIPYDNVEYSGKYLLFNADELRKLEQLSGCQVTSIMDRMETGVAQQYVYFVQFIHNSSLSGNVNAIAVMDYKDAVDIILSDEEETVESGDKDNENGNKDSDNGIKDSDNVHKEGYCVIAAFPEKKYDRRGRVYKDSQGQVWKTME